MRIPTILMWLCILISLIGCSSMRGNVVPKTEPTMEQVYDSMGRTKTSDHHPLNTRGADLTTIRESINPAKTLNTTVGVNTFRKLPNPDLTLYVYPHLAGNAGIPIPGYSTVFNAYEHDHYELSQETLRD